MNLDAPIFGKFAGTPWARIPSWWLKWASKNYIQAEIRQKARETLDLRNRLGVPAKPKKPGNQREIPLQDDRQTKKQPVIHDFLGSNANFSGNDAF